MGSINHKFTVLLLTLLLVACGGTPSSTTLEQQNSGIASSEVPKSLETTYPVTFKALFTHTTVEVINANNDSLFHLFKIGAEIFSVGNGEINQDELCDFGSRLMVRVQDLKKPNRHIFFPMQGVCSETLSTSFSLMITDGQNGAATFSIELVLVDHPGRPLDHRELATRGADVGGAYDDNQFP
jgi:hypothetical protein